MSSYTSDPYFDPRSRYSQAHSLGDIGGQPMLTEPYDEKPPCPCSIRPASMRSSGTGGTPILKVWIMGRDAPFNPCLLSYLLLQYKAASGGP